MFSYPYFQRGGLCCVQLCTGRGTLMGGRMGGVFLVCTESWKLRLQHPYLTVSVRIQINVSPMRLHGPRRPILRQTWSLPLRSGGLGGRAGCFAALHTCQILPWPPMSHHSRSVCSSAFITCQRGGIHNMLDDERSAAEPPHAAAWNLTRRLFRRSGKSSQHEILPTANNWHTESIRTTEWQICFWLNATCQWWIVSATKPFFKWIQQLGFGPHVNSFDKCTLLCLSSFCSIIFMLKWSNLFLLAQSVGVDYPSQWCPPR